MRYLYFPFLNYHVTICINNPEKTAENYGKFKHFPGERLTDIRVGCRVLTAY